MIVVLDTGPLGRISNPRASALNTACYQWLEGLVQQGIPVFVPEIADYEVRRELLRARKPRGLARLDLLKTTLGYLPITTSIMLTAAELWAQARQQGHPTAGSAGARWRRHPGRASLVAECGGGDGEYRAFIAVRGCPLMASAHRSHESIILVEECRYA